MIVTNICDPKILFISMYEYKIKLHIFFNVFFCWLFKIFYVNVVELLALTVRGRSGEFSIKKI